MRVLIIGAGIGGMTLAHGLRRSGVEVAVYERHSASANELAGYGLHVNAFGLDALESCLSEKTWSRFLADSAPASDLVTFHDQNLHQLLQRHGAGGTRRRGVNRTALQALLVDELAAAGVIRFGKTFTRYHILDDVLVAADGPNSRVRGQYLPDVKRQDLGVVAVAARYLLGKEREAGLPPTFLDGSVNNIVPNSAGWIFSAAWRSPEQEHNLHRTDADGDYITWAYADARQNYPADLDQMGQLALRNHVLDRIDRWSPVLRRMVGDSLLETVALMPLKTMPHLDVWPSSQVTLVGDAIHNMTPMAGVGANTALRDAFHLRDALVAAGRDNLPIREAIARYEQEMRAYANPSVAISARNARSAGSDAVLPRVAFRAALRVAEVVPPMKRAMFKAQNAVTTPEEDR
jgi:2-polyprenyl-6-methoxyphenol hydroxylase-like FAD-dependent oxidoreductase